MENGQRPTLTGLATVDEVRANAAPIPIGLAAWLPHKTNLNLPGSIAELPACFQFETGNEAMGTALQINSALWIMIGCAIAKAEQFLGFMN